MRPRIFLQWLAAERSQWLDAQSIRQRQSRELARMLRHALTRVPHYRAHGLDASDTASGAVLRHLPILTKHDLRRAGADLLADGYIPSQLHWSRTSGSSGEPTVTWFDEASWSLCRYVLKARRLRAMAPLLGRRVLIVSDRDTMGSGGSARETPPTVPGIYSERTVSLYDDVGSHVEAIDDFRPNTIQTYPSHLDELVRTYAALRRTPPRIQWLCTSSELLRPAMRKRAEHAFGGRIFDVYGSTEFKEIAWQCRHGSYHVNFESVLIEIVEDGIDDGAGAIIVSTLCNQAMPLLRYATGDRGTLRWTRCACGRESPQLELAAGRQVEMIPLPSGRRISPYLLDIDGIETVSGLRQFRYVHVTPDHLRLELVMDDELAPAQAHWLHARISEALGEPVTVDVRRVDRIDATPGAKASLYRRDWQLDGS